MDERPRQKTTEKGRARDTSYRKSEKIQGLRLGSRAGHRDVHREGAEGLETKTREPQATGGHRLPSTAATLSTAAKPPLDPAVLRSHLHTVSPPGLLSAQARHPGVSSTRISWDRARGTR